jgi:hypothetical protein
MADLEYTEPKQGENLQEYLARLPKVCPVCGDDPQKDACPCACHEAVSRAIDLYDAGSDVGFERGGPHSGEPGGDEG